MYHDVRLTLEKITRYLGLIEPLVHACKSPIPPFRFIERAGPDDDHLSGPDVDDSEWKLIKPFTYWGHWGRDYTLRTTFTVPEDWDADTPVELYLPLGDAGDFSHPEALVYIDGEPYAACDRHHQDIRIPAKFRDGKPHLLVLSGWTGLGGEFTAPTKKTKLFMRPCSVALVDQPTRDFLALARVAHGAVTVLDEHDPARSRILNALDDGFKALDLREPFGDAFYGKVPGALEILRAGISKAGAPLDVDLAATGHAHIDVAWLWTLGQTRQKSGRTFHTVLRLMEEFPEYHFTQSQPQLYEYVQNDFPVLFDAIRTRVTEGRWEIIGGMWVEADCNISGHESLARQFLLGRTYFREHFGRGMESPVLWLPDVFGYAWNLPQLIKEAGLEYFFTIKISWNRYNRLPFDTFWWQGLDGTKVLTHFSTTPADDSPASVYNAHATPRQALGSWTNFQQKEINQELIMAFGYGDGGGGPTREMLENIREMKSFPGLPRMNQKSIGDFFQRLDNDVDEKLPVWNGELYFELHRGTYTTQSRSKRANRKSEFLLHDAEFLATMASMIDDDYTVPSAEIESGWKLVCLNQFHDIIPGSSIHAVYDESLEQYAEIAETATEVIDDAFNIIAKHTPGDVLFANPTSYPCRSLAFVSKDRLEDRALCHADGTVAHIQRTNGGILIDAGELPPYSVTALKYGDVAGMVTITGLSVSTSHIENEFVRIEINNAGDISRIFDKKAGREVLPEGEVANCFQAFPDRPLEWDAWDIDIYYDDKIWEAEPATAIRVVEEGPLRAVIEIERRILSSTYIQRLSLVYNSPRLDIATDIDWLERHVLLKAAFPVDVLSPTATYEIQWGNVERPTHRNTSWDWARFETCAQKWVDLSEGGYGMSLLNDCKYGHDIRDNVIRITLLRSPSNPDPEADLGEHSFTYSLLPHEGPWNEQTVAEAYNLNDPVRTYIPNNEEFAGTGATVSLESFISTDSPNVVIETVKSAEDGNGIVVRMYDCMRKRGTVKLMAAFPVTEAYRTNLLEENGDVLKVDGNTVSYDIRPFEIVTIRLVPKK